MIPINPPAGSFPASTGWISRYWIYIASILLLLISAPRVCADINEELRNISSRLSQLENQTGPNVDSALIERYRQARQLLQDTQKLAQTADEYRARIKTLPAEIKSLRATTNTALPPVALPTLKGPPEKQLEQLEQLQTRLKTTLLEKQNLRASHELLAATSNQKQITLQDELVTLRQAISQRIATQASTTDMVESPAEQIYLDAQSSWSNARIEVLELELLLLPGSIEQASLQQQILARETGALKQALEQVDGRLQLRRRSEAEKALHAALPEGVDTQQIPQLQQQISRNENLVRQVREVIAAHEQASQQQHTLNQRLELVSQSYRTIKQQLELDIAYSGSEVRRHVRHLSRPLDVQASRTAINLQRLHLLELDQQQFVLIEKQAGIKASGLTSEQQDTLKLLLDNEHQLLQKLRTDRHQLITQRLQLLAVQEQLNEQIRLSEELLSQNLLWKPDVAAIDLKWFNEVIRGLGHIVHTPIPATVAKISLPGIYQGKEIILLLLTAMLALVCWRYQNRHMAAWRQAIGHVRRDRIRHTIFLLLSAPLIALPLPLFLYLTGSAFQLHAPSTALHNGFYFAAVIFGLYFSLLIWMQQPTGLLTGHFHIPQETITAVRRKLHLITWMLSPMLIVSTVITQLDVDVLNAGLNRLLLLCVAGGLGLFWLSLWRLSRHMPGHIKAGYTSFWLAIMAGYNLVVFGLVLAGYLFTSIALIVLLFVIICIGLAVALIYRLGRRWVLVEERKLAFARVLAKRAEQIAAREDNNEEPPPEEDFLDLQTISEQTLMLLKVGSLTLLLALLSFALGWLLPTLDVLDSITLWSTVTVSDSGNLVDSVTLKGFLLALLVLGLSLVAAGNLPGMLELLVLNHLPLKPGTGYATSTILKYLLLSVGVISCLALLGVQWAKLQWLIAALGVGLGFGLQEIVANFVSGLIILFERPVRIGDTITLGDITGTVNKIKIRATTVIDWDRKEVVIPNKAFITDKLVNWSLSDAITRVTLQVGIAYGSDIELARRLLLEVAGKNRRVLPEPAPRALFMNFGDSTLDFQLRIHVTGVDDRIYVIDEMNSEIDRLFREHSIEIAFPQLDLHVQTTPSPGNPDPLPSGPCG